MGHAALVLKILDAPGIGPHRFYTLLAQHGSAEAVARHLTYGPDVPSRVRDHMSREPIDPYLATIEATHSLGADFKLWSDSDYPSNLSLWKARPALLFYMGDLHHLDRRSLALVGRVDPTAEGKHAATRFARLCVDHAISVVSGLAKGIDAASHRASLAEPPGYTYAVVGHGLDFVYPPENRDLFAAIPRRGAVISQFPLGVGPQKWTFPARNEVMCTLALGTVIVEGKPGCGSIIQAEFSFKHGRPVFLLSRNLRVGETEWARELVKKGAHVVEHFEQVIEIVQRTMGELWSGPKEKALTVAEPTDLLELLELTKGAEAVKYHDYALLFDIDGVIADSRDATAAALANLASRHLGRPIDYRSVNPTGSPTKVLESLGVPKAWSVYKSEFDEAFALASVDHMRRFDDVIRGIQQLKVRGVQLAAVTAQPKRRVAQLLPVDVARLFTIVLTYNETKGKKDVGINEALRRLGVARERAAFIGDQPTDLEAARRAGIHGVGVLWGFSEEASLVKWTPHLLLDQPTDISPSLIDLIFGNA